MALDLLLGPLSPARKDETDSAPAEYTIDVSHLMRTIKRHGFDPDSSADYVKACLPVWLRRADRVDEKSDLSSASAATSALVSVGTKQFLVENVFQERESYCLLNKALEEDHTVRTRWTTLCITGPLRSGKSSFLKKLLQEPLLTRQRSNDMSDSNSHREVALETTSLVTTRDAGSHQQWERLNDTILKRRIASEVKKNTPLPVDVTYKQEHSPDDSLPYEVVSFTSAESLVSDVIDLLLNASDDSIDLSQTHFINAINTGDHPAFLDIAPALLRYNSVNIITHRLDKELGSTSFASTGSHLTNKQVLEASVHSFTFLKPPTLNGAPVTTSPGKPNFIVLGTYYDRVKADAEVLDERNYQIKTMLVKFRDTILRYGSSLIFPINTTAEDDDDHSMKVSNAIRRKISKCYMEADVPLRWFLFQVELNRLQKVGRPLVKLSKCIKIGATFKMSPDEVKNALMYYSDLTAILYYPNILPDIVFLDTQSLIDKFLGALELSACSGMLNKDHLIDLFDASLTSDDFLKLLENLLLVAKLPNDGSYFFPCALPRASVTDLDIKMQGHLDPLVVKWSMGPVPQGLFPALLVYLVRKQWIKLELCDVKYRNVIRFSSAFLSGDILLVDSFHWLEIHFSGDPSKCQSIKTAVYNGIKEVVKTFNYDLQLSNPLEHFLCSKHKSTDHHLCTVNESKEMLCCSQDNTSYLINNQREAPWIVDMFHNQGSLYVVDDLNTAVTILKESKFRFRKWARLGQALGLSQSTIDTIDYDSTTKCLEECLNIVMKEEGYLTWKTLTNALERIDEKAAADYINSGSH